MTHVADRRRYLIGTLFFIVFSVLLATFVCAWPAGADPGDAKYSAGDPYAGSLDRTKKYSICNNSGVDLELVNLYADAAGMFETKPTASQGSAYPTVAVLRNGSCHLYKYALQMHNPHETSAVYMNAKKNMLVNVKNHIGPSRDGANWYTNNSFRYVFAQQSGYVGPTLSVRTDATTQRVNIQAANVAGDQGGEQERGASHG